MREGWHLWNMLNLNTNGNLPVGIRIYKIQKKILNSSWNWRGVLFVYYIIFNCLIPTEWPVFPVQVLEAVRAAHILYADSGKQCQVSVHREAQQAVFDPFWVSCSPTVWCFISLQVLEAVSWSRIRADTGKQCQVQEQLCDTGTLLDSADL